MNSTDTRLTRQIGTLVSNETYGKVAAIAQQSEWSIAKVSRDLINEALDAREESEAKAA